MKKILVLGAGIFFAFSALAGNLSLTGREWRLKPFTGEMDQTWLKYDFDDSGWLAQEQPGQWQMLPEFEFQQFGPMAYRLKFDFQAQPGKTYYLRFNGVFYSCNVWLNGYYLGRHSGYFAPFEFETTNQLRPKNILLVSVENNDQEGEHLKTRITGVFGYWDVISPLRNEGGIWRGVEIVETGRARFRHLWIGTTALAGEDARIMFYGEMRSQELKVAPYQITLDLEPENFSGRSYHLEFELQGEPGVNYFKKEFSLEKPALWNTWDRGKPNLYRVKVNSILDGRVQDQAEFLTGIRAIEKKCQPGEKKEGLCWQFVLNGKPIFIRGNNYAPGDAFLARAGREVYEKDLKLAIGSFYNLLRVHAHIDRPEFYELCDRYGILLWQDFPLQGHYAESGQVWKAAREQAMEMVWLLGSHPSIALWSCQNEPAPLKSDWNVKTLDTELKRILTLTDPTRPVNLASGLILETDGHLYLGWYISEPDQLPKLLKMPMFKRLIIFVTEFGAQAFPNYENAIKFMDADLSKIIWPDLEKYYMLQKKIMDERVPLESGMDLKQYISATQDYQARIQKYHIDWLRSLKYTQNWGIVSFLFNDPEPNISWAVVDYWRSPKKAYYAIQQSFQPVYAFCRWQFAPYKKGSRVSLPVFVVNDLLECYSGEVRAEITRDGKTVYENKWQATLDSDMPAKQIGEITFKADSPGDYNLTLTLSAPGLDKPVENLTVLKVGGK